jgi:hypothetical protein
MKKLKLTCNANRCENIEFEEWSGKLYVEIVMDRDHGDSSIVELKKSDVATLIAFLNGVELAE